GPLGDNRPHYNYLTAPGTSIEDGIVIESRSAESLRLRVYAADAHTTPDGLLDLAPAAEPTRDAGAWVAFGQPFVPGGEASGVAASESAVELTLDPGTSVTVPLVWNIPADAGPGDHAAGIVTSLVEDRAAASVQVDRRLALRAYLALGGDIAPGLTISDLRVRAAGSANPFTSGRLTVAYTLSNTGSARLVPTERIAVRGPFGWGGRDGADGAVLPEILPGSHLSREVTVAGVFPLVRTTTEVMVDAVAVGLGAEGATASGRGGSTIWTVPWLWLGVLAVLSGGAVAWPRVRAKRAGERSARAARSARGRAGGGDTSPSSG
ncbi:MAG: hypothetical protein LBK95_03185, partial [Bifidobacteriaceae bacterium]|nr:hypothetical protein [Bifidobacteriaceae bacterium]